MSNPNFIGGKWREIFKRAQLEQKPKFLKNIKIQNPKAMVSLINKNTLQIGSELPFTRKKKRTKIFQFRDIWSLCELHIALCSWVIKFFELTTQTNFSVYLFQLLLPIWREVVDHLYLWYHLKQPGVWEWVLSLEILSFKLVYQVVGIMKNMLTLFIYIKRL